MNQARVKCQVEHSGVDNEQQLATHCWVHKLDTNVTMLSSGYTIKVPFMGYTVTSSLLGIPQFVGEFGNTRVWKYPVTQKKRLI